ncbi:hypothetical protein ACFVWT_04240 [Arthrobacter sp. NPDC058288]
MGMRPIDKLLMWFNRTQTCAECGTAVDRNGPAYCSDACWNAHQNEWAI